VLKLRWETLSVLVGREAVAVAVVLATTFGGWGTQHALASNAAARAAKVHVTRTVDPAEAVFAFADDLDAVNYQIAYLPDSRNDDRLIAACQAVFADQPKFQAALQASDKTKDIANDLLAEAEPTIEVCFDPLSADEDAEGRAAEGFAAFHESAFDFASVLQK
jgi:hypothetical protein